MLAPEVVQEIERLLAEDRLSQRQIARTLGVSRGVISTIAKGRRPEYQARRLARLEEQAYQPEGPIERCRGCGGRVHMPCRLCRARDRHDREQQLLRQRRREARQRALRRLLVAVLHAADEAQRLDATPADPPRETAR